MAAIDNLNPAELTAVKAFAYAFRSAPTPDLVDTAVFYLSPGGSSATVLDFLFNFETAGTPFANYRSSASDQAFVTALVDNFTFGTSIDAQTKAAWVAELTPLVDNYPSRGAFVYTISNIVDTYQGSDPDLIELRDALHDRVEAAAEFLEDNPNAVYAGETWLQLADRLEDDPDPQPSYELTSSATTVNEGQSVTFTLETTDVPAGTEIDYTLSGPNIDIIDVIGGQLAGTFVVGADGRATTTITLTNDATTEGTEQLRLTLEDDLGQVQVAIADTSAGPTPPATYNITPNTASRNEGGSITYTLTTTNVAAGTVVPFILLGTGITEADIAGGSLAGTFTVDAQGTATATVALTNDTTTEGAEVLRLRLPDGTYADVTINDTSIGAAPSGSADTVVITDTMENQNAELPETPAEGEIRFDTYLTYDFLNQAGSNNLRMSVDDLEDTGAVAGAPLVTTNFSADRGNIPQVANQSLFTFDTGLLTDRVDYSAETGKIVVLVNDEHLPGTQYVLVNDNGTDDDFGDETDRIDTLRNVEEIVASEGGGVLDLTNSGRDLEITFSRNFNAATDTVEAQDREVHRVRIVDEGTATPYGTTFIEYRDAGDDPDVTQDAALWSTVQGGDNDETLIFTGAESMDLRTNVLRGGDNEVKFNELTRSILIDVSMTAWAESTDPADDTNDSGVIELTTSFTNGDGSTLLSANTNTTSSHTPDNAVAAGSLTVAGSQDAEDRIAFADADMAKIFTLGQTIGGADGASVRMVGSPSAAALRMTGIELLEDNDASDDLYVVDDIDKALDGSPEVVDGAGDDHDGIRIADEALGSAATGGDADAVDLAAINAAFGVDFDVLDLSAVTATGLTVSGTAGTDDELVLGALGSVSAVTGFESIVLTDASTDKGSSLTLDLDAGVVRAGATELFDFDGTLISADGLLFGTDGQQSFVDPTSIGFTIEIVDESGVGGMLIGSEAADTLTGGSGDDTFRGRGGNDTLDAGEPAGDTEFAERWDFELSGTPDATAAAGNRITITVTIDGEVLTLSEAAAADTNYADGDGAVVDGATTAAIGSALAALINANLGDINDGPGAGVLEGASFVGGDTLRLDYFGGVDAGDAVSVVVAAGADAGSFAIDAGVNTQGGTGGSDTFVFEATAAANGRDTITNFTAGSDLLDFSAFAGGAITADSPWIDALAGGTFAGVPTTAEFVYNRSGPLSTGDFATAPAAGKFVIADGGRSIVAVTLDPTGDRGTASNSPISFYYVENGAAAGLSDLSVALVGTVSGPAELTFDQVFDAMTP